MRANNIFFPVASIIKIFILLSILTFSSKSEENESKFFSNDKGILSIMYHRFDEIKYPSTNIRMEVFRKHMDIISKKNYSYLNPKEFDKKFSERKIKKKILITIDDGFSSFYKKNKYLSYYLYQLKL